MSGNGSLAFAASHGEPASSVGLRAIVGQAPAMHRVFTQIRAAASTSLPVLVEGESGTGKELVARAIHELSSRAAAPFLAVNTPALPDSLLEAELFGFRRGAFTGASHNRDGIFRSASGGVLFLDEISSMSPLLQAKLLRVLQEGEVMPLGHGRTVRVDVRVIAATNRLLDEAVTSGSFRSDLYYRLNVLRIRLPPLRERTDDIPLLTRHFIARLARDCGHEPKSISPAAIDALCRRSWNGNVRELYNVIARAYVNSPGLVVELRDVSEELPPSPAALGSGFAGMNYHEAKEQVLRTFQYEYARGVFTACGGNVTRAAAKAGITRAAFRRILQQAMRFLNQRGQVDDGFDDGGLKAADLV